MNVQPITIVFALIGGLLLAGILGWIRKARLVVFVPRLFSHSKISDKGQIAEISVMNRGFKTEEGIELLLNPAMHYELVGSNNPDATIVRNKLCVPRIGSADDCSILLQVENGNFTHADIVSCLSKETKATVTTKLEDVPVTAQQRVGLIIFFGLFSAVILAGYKGIDYFFGPEDSVDSPAVLEPAVLESEPPDLQGWNIADIYAKHDNAIYKLITSGEVTLLAEKPTVRGNVLRVPVTLKNESDVPLTLSMSVSATLPQDGIEFSRRRIHDKLVLPHDVIEATLEAAVPAEANRQTVVIEVFLRTPDGESMKAVKIVRGVES